MPLQTILIPRDKKKDGEEFIRRHKFKLTYYGKGPDKTKNFYRYRQRKPKKGKRFYTIKTDMGYELIYMY